MTDYSQLIDAEIWAFIEKTNASYPPDAVDLSIQQQREVYNRMCAAFRVGYPDGVSTVDGVINREHKSQIHPVPPRQRLQGETFETKEGTLQQIPIRTYTLSGSYPKAQIVYFHGGGFVVGGLESHDDSCAELCAGSGLPLTAVDYRLAPEHTHPAAFDDALAAYRYMAANSELPIILVGDSAGGTLAAAVSHATRGDVVKPIGQVLLYPALGGDKSQGSYIEHAEAPMLTVKDMQFYDAMVSGGLDTAKDIRLNPLADSDFSGLPATTVISAQCDPLADDGRDYRDRILAAGGKAEWFNEAGLVHGFIRARHGSQRAGASFRRVVDVICGLSAVGASK